MNQSGRTRPYSLIVDRLPCPIAARPVSERALRV